jgi:Phosphatidylethanolamine-binding protein
MTGVALTGDDQTFGVPGDSGRHATPWHRPWPRNAGVVIRSSFLWWRTSRFRAAPSITAGRSRVGTTARGSICRLRSPGRVRRRARARSRWWSTTPTPRRGPSPIGSPGPSTPGATGLGEGEAAPVEGHNDFGTNGYRGPCSSPGHGRHRYCFRLYRSIPIPVCGPTPARAPCDLAPLRLRGWADSPAAERGKTPQRRPPLGPRPSAQPTAPAEAPATPHGRCARPPAARPAPGPSRARAGNRLPVCCGSGAVRPPAPASGAAGRRGHRRCASSLLRSAIARRCHRPTESARCAARTRGRRYGR